MLTISGQTVSMRYAFYTGWVLLLGAFCAAAAETIARTLPGGTGLVLSSAELWEALWPGAYMIAKLRLSAAAPELWNAAMMTVLALPGWVLLGLPGVVLAWTCRPNQDLTPMAEEELKEHEASLFLYDDLAREAKKWASDEGDDPHSDDRLPNQDVVDLFERDGGDEEDYEIEPLPDFVKPRDS